MQLERQSWPRQTQKCRKSMILVKWTNLIKNRKNLWTDEGIGSHRRNLRGNKKEPIDKRRVSERRLWHPDKLNWVICVLKTRQRLGIWWRNWQMRQNRELKVCKDTSRRSEKSSKSWARWTDRVKCLRMNATRWKTNFKKACSYSRHWNLNQTPWSKRSLRPSLSWSKSGSNSCSRSKTSRSWSGRDRTVRQGSRVSLKGCQVKADLLKVS